VAYWRTETLPFRTLQDNACNCCGGVNMAINLKVEYMTTGNSNYDVNKILELLEEHIDNWRYDAQQNSMIQKTQKETRYHEGHATAFQTVIDYLFRIDVK
jgi:hypothetical protein